MNWFPSDWSWLRPKAHNRSPVHSFRPQFEELEDRLYFNVNPLVPRGLNPIEGVAASNQDWIAEWHSSVSGFQKSGASQPRCSSHEPSGLSGKNSPGVISTEP